MGKFFIDHWEQLTGLWRKKSETDIDNDLNMPDVESRRMFTELFEIRQAMFGRQHRMYDVDEAWEKIKPVRRFIRWKYALKYAALVVLAIGAGYWGWRFAKPKTVPLVVNESIAPGHPCAELVLASGERVQVDNRRQIYIPETVGAVITNDTAGARVRYRLADEKTTQEIAFHTFIVPQGGEYSLELPDGTVVWMNAESSLRFPEKFAKDKREVYLQGEAYFQVAKNTEQPFYVHTERYDIRVLGTSFNVSAYSGDRMWYTTLVEGAVAVLGEGHQVVMKPNEQYRVDTESGEGELREVIPQLYTSWVEGKFYFKAYTFDELVKRLKRWYDFDIYYGDEAIKERRFSGVVNKYQPLQEILKFLEMSSDVCFRVEGRKVMVDKAK